MLFKKNKLWVLWKKNILKIALYSKHNEHLQGKTSVYLFFFIFSGFVDAVVEHNSAS